MPINSINWFGQQDTLNPTTGEFTPKMRTEVYPIPSPLTTGAIRIILGMIPNADLFPSCSAEIIEPTSGAVISTLSKSRITTTTIGNVPLNTLVWVDIANINSSVWVNPAYEGKFLRITASFDTATVVGDWMNYVQQGFYRRRTFEAEPTKYKRGDIIWLEPITFDIQTPGSSTFPYIVPAEDGYMKKSRTYLRECEFRQYAVRLRANVDNPISPDIVGAIGNHWLVDDPENVVEFGDFDGGRYKLYANGDYDIRLVTQLSGQTPNVTIDIKVILPIESKSSIFPYFPTSSGQPLPKDAYYGLFIVFQEIGNVVKQSKPNSEVHVISRVNSSAYCNGITISHLESTWY